MADVLDGNEISEEDNSEFESAFAEFAEGNDSGGGEGGSDSSAASGQNRDATGDDQGANASASKEEEDARDKRIRELEHDLDSQRGRVSGLTKALNTTRQELITTSSRKQANGPGSGDGDGGGTEGDEDGEWATLRKEFPELAGAIDRKFSKLGARVANTEAVVTATVEPLMVKDQRDYVNDQFKKLGEVHPDWTDVVKSPEYKAWLPTQSEDVQKLVKSQKASDAIFLVTGFKASTGKVNGGRQMTEVEKIQEKRKAQLATGAGIQSRKVGRGVADVDSGDFEANFAHFAKKRDAQRAAAMNSTPGRRNTSW